MRAFAFNEHLAVFPIFDWITNLGRVWMISSFTFGFIPGMVFGATKDFDGGVAAVHKRFLREE